METTKMTAIDALLIYVLCCYFFYWLLNYAAITHRPATWLKRVLGPKLGYPLGCAMCFPFWATLTFYLFGYLPGYYVFAAPVIHLFLDTVYDRLGTPPTL